MDAKQVDPDDLVHFQRRAKSSYGRRPLNESFGNVAKDKKQSVFINPEPMLVNQDTLSQRPRSVAAG